MEKICIICNKVLEQDNEDSSDFLCSEECKKRYEQIGLRGQARYDSE